uniref:Uncharacterized protein n=1 Tax=Aegilops tauschii subsp. strangulata TaxID=200361 RepID=A0A453L1B2_AEGTS
VVSARHLALTATWSILAPKHGLHARARGGHGLHARRRGGLRHLRRRRRQRHGLLHRGRRRLVGLQRLRLLRRAAARLLAGLGRHGVPLRRWRGPRRRRHRALLLAAGGPEAAQAGVQGTGAALGPRRRGRPRRGVRRLVPGAFGSLVSGDGFTCALETGSLVVRCWGPLGSAVQAAFANVSVSSLAAGGSRACGVKAATDSGVGVLPQSDLDPDGRVASSGGNSPAP